MPKMQMRSYPAPAQKPSMALVAFRGKCTLSSFRVKAIWNLPYSGSYFLLGLLKSLCSTSPPTPSNSLST